MKIFYFQEWQAARLLTDEECAKILTLDRGEWDEFKFRSHGKNMCSFPELFEKNKTLNKFNFMAETVTRNAMNSLPERKEGKLLQLRGRFKKETDDTASKGNSEL